MRDALYVLAEAVGGSNFVPAALVTQLGFSAIFLWQWQDERKERRAAQTALASLFERLLPVLEEATSTLERVQSSMAKQVEKAERIGPTPDDMASTMRRLENLTDDLGRQLRRTRDGE